MERKETNSQQTETDGHKGHDNRQPHEKLLGASPESTMGTRYLSTGITAARTITKKKVGVQQEDKGRGRRSTDTTRETAHTNTRVTCDEEHTVHHWKFEARRASGQPTRGSGLQKRKAASSTAHRQSGVQGLHAEPRRTVAWVGQVFFWLFGCTYNLSCRTEPSGGCLPVVRVFLRSHPLVVSADLSQARRRQPNLCKRER